jgi:hypothetical protein
MHIEEEGIKISGDRELQPDKAAILGRFPRVHHQGRDRRRVLFALLFPKDSHFYY